MIYFFELSLSLQALNTNAVYRDWRCPNLEFLSWKGLGTYNYNVTYDSQIDLKRGEEIGKNKKQNKAYEQIDIHQSILFLSSPISSVIDFLFSSILSHSLQVISIWGLRLYQYLNATTLNLPLNQEIKYYWAKNWEMHPNSKSTLNNKNNNNSSHNQIIRMYTILLLLLLLLFLLLLLLSSDPCNYQCFLLLLLLLYMNDDLSAIEYYYD